MYRQGVSVPVKAKGILAEVHKKDHMSAKEPKIIYFNFISVHIACENKLSH